MGRIWTMYEGRNMINSFNCTVPIRFTTARATSQVPKNNRSGVNKFVQKSRSHLKSLGTKRMTRSKFHTADPRITGADLAPGICASLQ
jgi:hypothetical protein